jgi:hypothetical protein
MVRLATPYSGFPVEVPDELVKRYTDAGYRPVDGQREIRPPEKPKGNASRDEWADYADSIGVPYDEDAKREDIKAAVEAAGEDE